MTRNNYQVKIEQLQQDGLFQPGEVYQADIEHEPGCKHFEDPALCDCSAEITIKRYIEADDTWEIVFLG